VHFNFNKQSLYQIYSPRRIWHYGYLQRTYANKWIQKQLISHVTLRSRVLDFGCGNSPQKGLIDSQLGAYVGIDVKQTTFGIVFDGKTVPFGSGSFDVVLLNEVLYAIPDGRAAISECHRLLRTGGALLVSTNFIYPLNGDPEEFRTGFRGDYFRFTEAGLRELLIPYFEPIYIDHLGGLGSILLMPQYFYRNHLMRHPRKFVRNLSSFFAPAFLMGCVVLNLLGLLLNKLDSSNLFASDIVAVAKK